MKKLGVALVILAYLLLLYTSLAAPAYARTHQNLGPAMLAEYAGPWPVALECTLAVAGIILVLIPFRHGERWALWTLRVIWIIPLLTRLTTDPRCRVVLDPHQHGCHTFMIASVLAIVGLLIAR